VLAWASLPQRRTFARPVGRRTISQLEVIMRFIPVSALAILFATACDRPTEDRGTATTGASPASAPESEKIEERREAAEERREEKAEQAEDAREEVKGREIEVEFKGAEGTEVEGEVKLEEMPDGVRVVIDMEKFPAGVKGAHIHETADCSDIRAKSMGEHFNPQGHEHGLPAAGTKHMGDMGNITIDQDGKGHLEFLVKGATLKEGDKTSLIGRSVVIHESKDTGTVPSAGNPLACAPIDRS
jgi:superoxide dismutase, Cu-Zn family